MSGKIDRVNLTKQPVKQERDRQEMIVDIFKSIMANFQQFLVIWVVVLLVNQIFIFHACFAPYCLLAALPHTGIIAALIMFFIAKEKQK